MEIEESHLLNVHVDVCHGFAVVQAHHGGSDGDRRLAVGRHRSYFIVATSAAGSLVVRAERVEAVLARARFPHVFSKVTAG